MTTPATPTAPAALQNGLQSREMTVRVDREALAALAQANAARADGTAADDRVPIAISSETPVRRYDYWEGEYYNEILDHTRDAIDLSYAKDGLPFLADHDTRQQQGIVEDIGIGTDGVLRGLVRFSARKSAQNLKRDMLDGIRTKISVGYRVLESVRKDTKDDNTVPDVHITRWMPMEASSVPIPADYSVGVGRSAGDAPSEDVQRAVETLRRSGVLPLPTRTTTTTTPAPKAEERTVSTTANAAPESGAGNSTTTPVAVVNERQEGERAERARSTTIRQLGRLHNATDEQIDGWINEGRTIENVAAELFTAATARGDQRGATGRPAVEFTDKERKQYSFASAIRNHALAMEGHRVEDSFERDVHQELLRKMPEGGKLQRDGFLVPTFTSAEVARAIMAEQNGWGQRAGLDSGTSTKGSELKFTQAGEFIALLRNKLALADAGVQMLFGLQGPVAFPQQTGAASAAWVGENGGTDVPDSNLTLAQVALAPKTLMASTSYSRQLLAQSVVDVDAMVREDLARVNALALDVAGISGTGTSNQPTGILNQSGIGSIALGANGATPTYNNLVDLETQVTGANADQWPLSYLMHPVSRGTLKKATVLGNTTGLPVWTKADESLLQSRIQGGSSRVPGEVNGYTAWASAQVPNNLTKGTSAGICLAILFGAFSQFVIGDWGMMELVVDPYRLKKQGMIEVTSFAMYGMALKYAAALAAIKDALQ